MALSLIQLTLGVFKNPRGGSPSGPGRRASDFASPGAAQLIEFLIAITIMDATIT